MPDSPLIRPDASDELSAALRDRILVLDGAMGTMIQRTGSVRPTTAASGSPTGTPTCRATTTCSA